MRALDVAVIESYETRSSYEYQTEVVLVEQFYKDWNVFFF